MLDLGGADPECERSKRTVGRCVAVAADDRYPGPSQAQFGADHVHNALGPVPQVRQRDAKLPTVDAQLFDLLGGNGVQDRKGLIPSWDAVVHRGLRPVGPAHADSPIPQSLECLRGRDLVHEVEVNIEDGWGARLVGDDMCVPDLLV